MTYKAKVDWWIALAILAGIALPAMSAMTQHMPSLAAPSLILPLFMLVFVYPQKYEASGDSLRIRSGLMTRTIPWRSITRVSASEEPGISLVLSTDRVVIEYAGGKVLIAPADQARFFDDVASHCPQLSQRGMDLTIALN